MARPNEAISPNQGAMEKEAVVMRKQRGFSLIELLIVVAIILVIAAIAIPNLMRARMAANDSSAVASIRSINTAEVAYFGTYPTVGFPLAIGTLGGASPCTPGIATACLIDNSLSSAIAGTNGKSGYYFSASGSASAGSPMNDQFFATGTPLSNTLGTRSYCSIQDAVVRVQPAGNISLVASLAACSALTPMN
jgi:type IV pilus assembly protein PilA